MVEKEKLGRRPASGRRRSRVPGGAWTAAVGTAVLLAVSAPAGSAGQQGATRFEHEAHRSIDCQTCHATGQPTATTNPAFCRDCHHRRARAGTCQSCHRPGELEGRRFEATRTLTFSVREDSVRRTLPFRHEPHTELACTRCHTGGTALSAAGTSCATCHAEHHDLDADCAACHAPAEASAHPREEAHLTCTGSGCHAPAPFPQVPRTRSACVACHLEMSDHRPGRACDDCHVLPAPHPQAAPGDTAR